MCVCVCECVSVCVHMCVRTVRKEKREKMSVQHGWHVAPSSGCGRPDRGAGGGRQGGGEVGDERGFTDSTYKHIPGLTW